MACTIAAPPARIWPWLVQMGCDRAGFYSWDRLDNRGRASAERIHPGWQALAEGDRVLAVPDGSAWFDVAMLEPERTLILRSSLALPRALTQLADWLFWEPAHWVMQRRQFAGLRRRATASDVPAPI